MFFVKTPSGAWVPCGPKQPGAIQITMQELAAKGLAAQVSTLVEAYVYIIVCVKHNDVTMQVNECRYSCNLLTEIYLDVCISV